MVYRLSDPWIKERVMEFSEEGSTKRIHCRIRSDGYLFYQQLSDHHHTVPFEDQIDRLDYLFSRFATEQPSTGRWTEADFDQDFNERLALKPGKEIVLCIPAAAKVSFLTEVKS